MENRLPLRISLGLVLAVAAAYFPVLQCDFVNFDDASYIYQNPHVRTGLTRENIVWAWTGFHAGNWHPLTWMSHQLDCQLFARGDDLRPSRHHLVNLGWHLANTVALYLVLRRMTGEEWRPALVAALFGLHPLHVESVAWVSERKDVLSAFFAILTLGMYSWYAARPSLGRYLAVAASFALGLLCKPMLVTWPCVLLLMDYWPLQRFQNRARSVSEGRSLAYATGSVAWLVLEKLPLLALAAASSLVTMLAQRGAMKPSAHLALGFRLGNAVVSYAAYLRKMVWPMDLAAFYRHQGTRLPLTPAIVSGVVLILLSLVALLGFRRRPALLVGWLWYLGTLVPVIGLVQVGIQSMADRYTYIPLIGIFLALAWSIPELNQEQSPKRKRGQVPRLRFGLCSLVVLICGVLTFRQTQFWHNSETLWSRTLEVDDNPISRCYYAGALRNKASTLYAEADELSRKGRVAESERRRIEAKVQTAAAERQCQIALQMEPDLELAHDRLALYRISDGNLEGALTGLQQGEARAPQSAGLRDRLGRVLAYQGRMEEAGRQFREACRLSPKEAALHFDLATALAQLGDREGALREGEIGRQLKADLAEEMRAYAESFLDRSKGRRPCPAAAVFHAQAACWASPRPQAELYRTLAEAHAAASQPLAAHAAAERALALAETHGRADLLAGLRRLTHSYQSPARQREAQAAAAAWTAPALPALPGAFLSLAILDADQAAHRLPGSLVSSP